MDSATETAASSPVQTGGSSRTPGAQEDLPSTDLNPVAQAPSLKFPVQVFYSEALELWFWQLEAMFQVNRVSIQAQTESFNHNFNKMISFLRLTYGKIEWQNKNILKYIYTF